MASTGHEQWIHIGDNGGKQSILVEEQVRPFNGTVPEWVVKELKERQPIGRPDSPPPKREFPPPGKIHLIPRGRVYRLIEYMWSRETANYDSLVGPVIDSEAEPQTLRSLVNKTNNTLRKLCEPWRLHTDSTTRVIRKEGENPQKRDSQ